MRNTGSRDPRDRREASATSPVSIAVKTFSIRFGSRRIHRPVHQNARSSTTATPMIDTIKIGHMIGPPFWKLSIRKFVQPVLGGGAAGAAGLAAGEAALKVAETAGLGIAPGAAGDVAGAPGEAGAGDGVTAGGARGAAGPGAPGDVAPPGGGGRGGGVAGAGGGVGGGARA